MSSSKKTLVCASILLCAFLIIYSSSASHTVVLDDKDAAEFQTVGAVGGILHQPYPLWCVVARLFSLLPIGEAAFRVTLVSIVFGSLAVGLLFLLVFRRTNNYMASIGSAGAFGLSFTFWHFSALPEVYALATFLFIATLYLIERLRTEKSESAALLFFFVAGLLISQQSLNVAAIPGFLVLIMVSKRIRRQLFARRLLTLRIAAFIIPFTLYVYTFLVDRGPYPMNWLDQYGQFVAEAQGVEPGRMESFLGRLEFQMWVGRLNNETRSIGAYASAAYHWLRDFVGVEFPFLAAVFVITGFLTLWRRDARYSVFLLTLMMPYLVLALSGIGETFAYTLPVYAASTLLLAEGFMSAARLAKIRWKAGKLVLAGLAFLLGVLPVLRYARISPTDHLSKSSKASAEFDSGGNAFVHLAARNDLGKKYGIRIAEIAAPGDVIFARWAEANVLFYHKYVVGRLSDVGVFYVLPRWDQFARIIDRTNPKTIYLTCSPKEVGLDMLVATDEYQIFPGHSLYAVHLKAHD